MALAFGLAGALTGCNDSFMDRYPETSITEESFFKTVNDLEIYTNNMYGYLGGSYWDAVSDNMLYTESSSTYKLLGGTINPETVGQWNWSSIRNVNFMLARTGNVTGDPAEINHFIGLARMYRAKLYYDKVQSYSDVPGIAGIFRPVILTCCIRPRIRVHWLWTASCRILTLQLPI